MCQAGFLKNFPFIRMYIFKKIITLLCVLAGCVHGLARADVASVIFTEGLWGGGTAQVSSTKVMCADWQQMENAHYGPVFSNARFDHAGHDGGVGFVNIYCAYTSVIDGVTRDPDVRSPGSASCVPQSVGAEINENGWTCYCPKGTRYLNDVQKCIAITPVQNRPKSPKGNGPSCDQPSCGNPITLGTGNKVQVENDFEDQGAGELSVQRIYNGGMYGIYTELNTDFGNQWSYLGSRRLLFKPVDAQYACYQRADNYVVFCESSYGSGSLSAEAIHAILSEFKVSAIRSDGKILDFVKDNLNHWVADKDVNDVLTPQYGADGTTVTGWVISTFSNDYEYYDTAGRLIGINHRYSGLTRYTYSDGTTNSTGSGRLPLDAPICARVQNGPIVAAGHLLCITDQWGRQLSFEYDANARISAIVTPNGERYEYHYDEATGGCATYNSQNKACLAGNLTSVTFPDGTRRLYHYNESSLINDGNTCPYSASVGTGYGSLISTLTGITDENGVRYASWIYDCNGQAFGSWHAGGVEKVTLEHGSPASDGSQTVYTNLTLGTASNPIVINHARGYQYQLVLGVSKNTEILGGRCDNCGEFSSRTYDSRGNTIAGKNWNGSVNQFTFEPIRNLETSRIEAAGTVAARTISTIWHKNYALPVQRWEPKKMTSFNYDNTGRLINRTEQATLDVNGTQGTSASVTGVQRVLSYNYNQFGQLLTITGPRKDMREVTTYTYDIEGNLSTVTNALGQITSYSNYDHNGRVGRIVKPNGMATDFSYTLRGWNASQTISDGTSAETTSFDYDNVGQLTKVSFADGSSVNYAYDPAHRLIKIADGIGNSIVYTLDNSGNRVSEQTMGSDGILARQITRVMNTQNQLSKITGALQ